MALEPYGRIMAGAAEAAMMPYNTLQDARREQKANTLLDLRAQAMQQGMDEEAQFDAAIQARDFDTAARIDPHATALYQEHLRQQAMTGLGDVAVRQDRIDTNAIDKRLMDERKFWLDQQRERNDQAARGQQLALQAAQERRLSSDTQRPEKAPEGYRWNGDSLEAIPGGPKDMQAAQPLSPKDTNTARVKLTQVKIARNQLNRALETWGKIKDSLSAGPGQATPTPEGKAFDAAINTMRGSVTALTRVPGVGAMSDYETRLDQSKFPSRWSYETVSEQQLQDLSDLLNTIEQGYGEMLGTPAKPAQSGEVDFNTLPEG